MDFGSTLRNGVDANRQTSISDSATVHPLFSMPFEIANDIALIHLPSPVTLNSCAYNINHQSCFILYLY
jgi:hypothetical protein